MVTIKYFVKNTKLLYYLLCSAAAISLFYFLLGEPKLTRIQNMFTKIMKFVEETMINIDSLFHDTTAFTAVSIR